MIFEERNGLDRINALEPSEAASGARLGFMGALSVTMDMNDRNNAEHMFSENMSAEGRAVNNALEARGEEPITPLYSSVPVSPDLAANPWEKYDLAGAFLSGKGTPEQIQAGSQMVLEYDKAILSMRNKHPDLDLPTAAEQFERVKKKREDAASQFERDSFTPVGYAGALAGTIASNFNPLLNPKQVAGNIAAGFAAPAKTAGLGAKVLYDFGSNAAVEAGAKLTGQARQREILGLGPESAGSVAADVGAAGIGGVILGGIGRGIGALFDHVKLRLRPGEAPPPDVPPGLSEALRAERDVNAVRDADPSINGRSVNVKGAASFVGEGEGVVSRVESDLAEMEKAFNEGRGGTLTVIDTQGRTLDQAAREIDPDAFRIYDNMRNDIERLKAEIAQGPTLGDAAGIDALRVAESNTPENPALLSEAALLEQTQKTEHFLVSQAKEGDLWARIKAEQAARNAGDVADRETANLLSRAQQQVDNGVRLAQAQQAMDKIKPLIERAYARAEGEWLPSPETSAVVREMVDRRASVVGEVKPKPKAGRVMTEADAAMERAVEAKGGLSVGETKGQAVARAASRLADEEDAALEKTLEVLASRIDEPGAVEGVAAGLDLDQKLTVGFDEKGVPIETTVRDLLRESVDDENMMKAVSVCRIS